MNDDLREFVWQRVVGVMLIDRLIEEKCISQLWGRSNRDRVYSSVCVDSFPYSNEFLLGMMQDRITAALIFSDFSDFLSRSTTRNPPFCCVCHWFPLLLFLHRSVAIFARAASIISPVMKIDVSKMRASFDWEIDGQCLWATWFSIILLISCTGLLTRCGFSVSRLVAHAWVLIAVICPRKCSKRARRRILNMYLFPITNKNPW